MKKTCTYIAAVIVVFFSIPVCGQKKEGTAYLVSNAHLDTQWSWDVQTSIGKYLKNTLTQNLYLLDNYPHYVFNFEGGVKYAWMKEYYPLEFEKVKAYVKKGRWHVSGASWEANDTNIPYPESFFRNILLGQEFYKKEFGMKSTDIFLPDCFGFSYTLPTVASHCGLIGFSTQKLRLRVSPAFGKTRIPFIYGLWRGVDGSRIMAVLDGRGYTRKFHEGDASFDTELQEIVRDSPNNIGFRYFGTGDRGGSATIPTLESIEDGIVSGQGPVCVKMAASDELYKKYMPFNEHPELPVYDGELLMDVHGTGCYTSQAAMKMFNRANEILADAAERAAVIADWLGGSAYPAVKLNEAWKRFIWHQFHDDLTGTSLPRAYQFSWNDELLSQTQFADVLTYASEEVASRLNTVVSGCPVVVFNALSYARTELVHAYVPMDRKPASVLVMSPDGKKVPAQLLSYADGKAEVIFPASVPPMSYSVYDLRPGEIFRRKTLRCGPDWIENRIYRVTLDANGDISSIVDKRYGKEIVEKGSAVRLAMIAGNESPRWPAWEIQKENIDRPSIPVDGNVRISINENGPVRATLKVEREYGTSEFVQYISLTDGAADDRIDIRTDIDWSQENSILKAEFPVTVSNSYASYDLGLGVVQRGNNTSRSYEVPAQQWADITSEDGSYGVSVISGYKNGWDKPDDNTLRLTLLHSPGVKNRYVYAKTQDFGHHTMTYSIIGHKGDWSSSGIQRAADSRNHMLYAFNTVGHSGELGKSFSMIRACSPEIDVKAFKKAESGNGYVIRVYEISGEDVKDAFIEFNVPIGDAQELNGIEEKKGQAVFDSSVLRMNMGRFSPRTLSVTFVPYEHHVRPYSSRSVNISYNAAGYTNDAFCNLADIDGKGNSYSYDLLPATLNDAGTDFCFGRLGYDNILKCEGDTIAIDTDGGRYRTLYLLAASVDGDRKAEIIADGESYCFDVPYYSGFYGQWGWLTQTGPGYMKKTPVAYIGTHRHNKESGNEPYVYTYMFKLAVPLKAGTTSVILPDDRDIVLFAASLSENVTGDFYPASEFRALP